MLQYLIHPLSRLSFFFFFFNDTATTEIYTLSLHDALPISRTVPEHHSHALIFCCGVEEIRHRDVHGERHRILLCRSIELNSQNTSRALANNIGHCVPPIPADTYATLLFD